nr:hypothetical transcript [Hymenolepis microstoma]
MIREFDKLLIDDSEVNTVVHHRVASSDEGQEVVDEAGLHMQGEEDPVFKGVVGTTPKLTCSPYAQFTLLSLLMTVYVLFTRVHTHIFIFLSNTVSVPECSFHTNVHLKVYFARLRCIARLSY